MYVSLLLLRFLGFFGAPYIPGSYWIWTISGLISSTISRRTWEFWSFCGERPKKSPFPASLQATYTSVPNFLRNFVRFSVYRPTPPVMGGYSVDTINTRNSFSLLAAPFQIQNLLNIKVV